ncbi:unnamed protein product [Moneuplotes crassus]|uniref:Uncharacterized protein n=1 Tax=Euplotes crassus TaxID=5936 RepID=A0AAD1XHK8_EUPCR|nr:unnamed protein product [Moneuplotes crassus]
MDIHRDLSDITDSQEKQCILISNSIKRQKAFAKKRKRRGIPEKEPTKVKYYRVAGASSTSASFIQPSRNIQAFGTKEENSMGLNYSYNQEPDYQKPIFDEYANKLRNLKYSEEPEYSFKKQVHDNPYHGEERIPSRGSQPEPEISRAKEFQVFGDQSRDNNAYSGSYKQPYPAHHKPLSANRINRNKKSQMQYENPDNDNQGFGNFGSLEGTQQIKLSKQKKRNDFVASLEEQIRLKSERQRKEKEAENNYSFPPQPSSSHSRRSHPTQPTSQHADYPPPSSSHSRRNQNQSSIPSYDQLESNPYSNNSLPGMEDREKQNKMDRVSKQKQMLLEQIEEQKRKKEEEKRRRQQEELEEEQRIKKEIEVLNMRERGEHETKKNKQKEFRDMLDQETEKRSKKEPNRDLEGSRGTMGRKERNEMPRRVNDVPPEFQDLAQNVEQKLTTNYSSIPKGKEMFNKEFKGTNTQRLNEIQLKFQNEIAGLEGQLKKVQDELRNKVKSEQELVQLKQEMKTRESQSNQQQSRLQEQLIELMKGYQQQITYLTKMRDQSGPQPFDRPGSNRSIGGKANTRGQELNNYEKMLFTNSSKPPVPNYGSSNVVIDFNNPSDKPYVKPYENNNMSGGNLDPFSNQDFVDLDKSASLNAQSKMVPVSVEKKKPPRPEKKTYDYTPKSLEGTNELGGTNGSTNRRLNKELDEIEKMNLMNQEEFPGSLRGTGNFDDTQVNHPPVSQEILPDDVESLRNTSNFEALPPQENEKDNLGNSFEGTGTMKVNSKELSDNSFKNGSSKLEKFEGFPELPEYEGIQKDYIATIKSRGSNQDNQNDFGDPLEGTAGTAGTGKSIDFDELQEKLAQKIGPSPNKPSEEPPRQERKRWGKPKDLPIVPTEDRVPPVNNQTDGIDDLLEQFSNKESQHNDVPVYESEPDTLKRYSDDHIAPEKYQPKMESILEQSNEFTKSGENDLLSKSERKLIEQELKRAKGEE